MGVHLGNPKQGEEPGLWFLWHLGMSRLFPHIRPINKTSLGSGSLSSRSWKLALSEGFREGRRRLTSKEQRWNMGLNSWRTVLAEEVVCALRDPSSRMNLQIDSRECG